MKNGLLTALEVLTTESESCGSELPSYELFAPSYGVCLAVLQTVLRNEPVKGAAADP